MKLRENKEQPMNKEIIPDQNLKTAVLIHINPDEQLSVIKKAKPRPNFMMIGNGTMNKYNTQSIDLLQELADATKAGRYLLLAIKNGIIYKNDYDPIVKVIGTNATTKDYIKKGYKELRERNIVRRIKRSHYMINPNALIPLDYDNALEIWNNAK